MQSEESEALMFSEFDFSLFVKSSSLSAQGVEYVFGVMQAKNAEKRFYKVVRDYIPNTTHSQGLFVQTGDIVQVSEILYR